MQSIYIVYTYYNIYNTDYTKTNRFIYYHIISIVSTG